MDTLTVKCWSLDWDHFRSPAMTRLVALAIARRSRGSGASWAKQSTLARDTSASKQTVGRCLADLEEAGWLKRVNRRRADGSRTSDMLWLTLPEVVLEASTVDRKEARDVLEAMDDDGSTVDEPDITVASSKVSPGEQPPITVTTQKESLKESRGREESVRKDADPLTPDYDTAVNLIWQMASKTGRTRSSKNDIRTALKAAIARGHTMERVLRGLGAYFKSPDATKDEGVFQKGAHVVLANDRWESFLDDDKARRAAGEEVSPRQQAALDDLGTLEEPSEKRQHVWMDLFTKGMAWDPERGPQPGRMGCRVANAIQLHHGVQPYAETELDLVASDDAAFD